jgi:hypothetical protein
VRPIGRSDIAREIAAKKEKSLLRLAQYDSWTLSASIVLRAKVLGSCGVE